MLGTIRNTICCDLEALCFGICTDYVLLWFKSVFFFFFFQFWKCPTIFQFFFPLKMCQSVIQLIKYDYQDAVFAYMVFDYTPAIWDMICSTVEAWGKRHIVHLILLSAQLEVNNKSRLFGAPLLTKYSIISTHKCGVCQCDSFGSLTNSWVPFMVYKIKKSMEIHSKGI